MVHVAAHIPRFGMARFQIVSEDDEFSKLRKDKVQTLKPAFKKDGTVTAANASGINDGAAALICEPDSHLHG